MPLSWGEELPITYKSPNKMVFTFASFADWEPMLMNGPSSFNKQDILLQRVEEDELISNVLFNICLMGRRHSI